MSEIVCKQQTLGRPVISTFVTQLLGLESGRTTVRHLIAWQYVQGVVRSVVVIALLQISWIIYRLKNFKNRLMLDNRVTAMSLVPPFLLKMV